MQLNLIGGQRFLQEDGTERSARPQQFAQQVSRDHPHPLFWRILAIPLAEPLISARQLTYLFVKDPCRLEAKERQVLSLIQQEKEIELA